MEQFRRQRRASMAAVEDAIARKQKEVAQQQAAEQAKTAEAAGAAAAAEASAAKDEAVSTAALLAQAKHPRSTPPLQMELFSVTNQKCNNCLPLETRSLHGV